MSTRKYLGNNVFAQLGNLEKVTRFQMERKHADILPYPHSLARLPGLTHSPPRENWGNYSIPKS